MHVFHLYHYIKSNLEERLNISNVLKNLCCDTISELFVYHGAKFLEP